MEQITAKVGDVVQVALGGSSGTGYSWDMIAMPPEVALCETNLKDLKPGRPGGPNEKTFTFLAIEEGTGTLKMGNFPPGRQITPSEITEYSICISGSDTAH